jgi:hypothetical protein
MEPSTGNKHVRLCALVVVFLSIALPQCATLKPTHATCQAFTRPSRVMSATTTECEPWGWVCDRGYHHASGTRGAGTDMTVHDPATDNMPKTAAEEGYGSAFDCVPDSP